MSDDAYGQSGLWKEAELGPLQERVLPRSGTRPRARRVWTPHGGVGGEVLPEQAQNGPSEHLQPGEATYLTPTADPENRAPSEPPEEHQDGAGVGTRTDGFATITLWQAIRIQPGDTVWYHDAPHIVKSVSPRGDFGFRACGVAPPYFGLAGVKTTVITHGREKMNGRLDGPGIIPVPLYMTLNGERLGWVSYLLCLTDKQQEAADETQATKQVWWTRKRRQRLQF